MTYTYDQTMDHLPGALDFDVEDVNFSGNGRKSPFFSVFLDRCRGALRPAEEPALLCPVTNQVPTLCNECRSFQSLFPAGQCGTAFTSCDASLACAVGHNFMIEDGLHIPAKEAGCHFLTPTRKQMSRALAAIDTEGFPRGIEALCAGLDEEAARDLRYYTLDETRGTWKVLIPGLEGKRALDCGCGWCNLAAALTRSAAAVCAQLAAYYLTRLPDEQPLATDADLQLLSRLLTP